MVAALNSILQDQISVKWGPHDRPTRLGRFVAFVHLPFSFRSLDLLCCFTLVFEGHFELCYKEKLELLDHAMVNFKRS